MAARIIGGLAQISNNHESRVIRKEDGAGDVSEGGKSLAIRDEEALKS